jgi:hypothetical protein
VWVKTTLLKQLQIKNIMKNSIDLWICIVWDSLWILVVNYFQRTCVGCLNHRTTCVKHFKKLGLTRKNHQFFRHTSRLSSRWHVFYAMQREAWHLYGLLNHQTSGANLLKSLGSCGRSIISLGIPPNYRVNDVFSVPCKVTLAWSFEPSNN